MATSDRKAPLATGALLAVGAGLAVAVATLMDWPLGISITIGAALGLVVGAAVDAYRPRSGGASTGTGAGTGTGPDQTST